ncbi:flagellar hook-basal body complex protein FliE [Legionella dresdenensis]|uniref:Flagellar hook-basal body complex protein FliE n=1 Tax=Legionella dresdenensis TaxID=450200 RepID=A0ABV8CGU3_9GAMM
MMIDPISTSHFANEIKSPEALSAQKTSFSRWLTDIAASTNDKLLAADSALQQAASGQAPNLHRTMLALEEAKLSFQFLEQIRNRLLSAYQDVLREQI